MKKILLFIGVCFVAISCTKENFIDTGLANGDHDCSMLEYMRGDHYNWDSTVVMIEHAGLTDLFEGKDPDYPKFTFFGVTSMSILRYMLDNEIDCIADMDPETCKQMLLEYVYDEVILAEEVPEGTKSLVWPPITGEGGVEITPVGGKTCRLFAETEDYEGVDDAGGTYIYLESNRTTHTVASANIKFTNGIIHSLHYNHTFGKL